MYIDDKSIYIQANIEVLSRQSHESRRLSVETRKEVSKKAIENKAINVPESHMYNGLAAVIFYAFFSYALRTQTCNLCVKTKHL